MRVLLVEDELEMVSNIRAALRRHDIILDHAASLEIAQAATAGAVHDAILLDRKLPDGDGLSLVPTVRRLWSGVPIIVISALGSSSDRIAGLDDGADDYLSKPFSIDELLARLRAVMRRNSAIATQVISLGAVAFDTRSRSVEVNGVPLELPRRELLVLEILLRRAGRTVSREGLEEAVYGYDDEIASNTMEAHISRLRRRLTERDAVVEIHNVRGVGYLIRPLQ
ncbi:Two-component response regulator [Devosia sp. LC5]|uniref:response regulator transcription factor n=1 Tax=Devosia sp. LC5 TaxID=1502724 RepID=UPI0004E2DBFE|nr:response regulator transcription factor [Devosia sp. LC5]KFC68238.1 Two-component response regulator [Devosia sp. LC5]